jgi:hypothetical protein
MGDKKIDVLTGGTVTIGETFKWKNAGPNKVTASDLSACLTEGTYEVPAEGNGKAGEKSATVRSDIQPGNYGYQTSDGIIDTNPKLTVNTSTNY